MGDIRHHVEFLKQVLCHRNQNMQVLESKFERFFTKRMRERHQHAESRRVHRRSSVASVKFDQVSKMHLYSRCCIISSYKAAGRQNPRIIYSSLPKVMSRVYTKRSVIRKVKNKIGKV